MEITEQIAIAKPVTEVWSALVDGLGEVHLWDSSVQEVTLSGTGNLMGLSFSQRKLVSDRGEMIETMTSFNPDYRSLSYRTTQGNPFMVKKISTTWSLTQNTDMDALVLINLNVRYRALDFLFGLFNRSAYRKKLKQQLSEFKAYIESR